jgi:hypothetical protein
MSPEAYATLPNFFRNAYTKFMVFGTLPPGPFIEPQFHEYIDIAGYEKAEKDFSDSTSVITELLNRQEFDALGFLLDRLPEIDYLPCPFVKLSEPAISRIAKLVNDRPGIHTLQIGTGLRLDESCVIEQNENFVGLLRECHSITAIEMKSGTMRASSATLDSIANHAGIKSIEIRLPYFAKQEISQAHAYANMLAKMPALESVKLDGMMLKDYFKFFMASLKKNSKIKCLTLACTFIESKQVKYLADYLRSSTSLRVLKMLSYSAKKIGDRDAIRSTLIPAINSLKNLRMLEFTSASRTTIAAEIACHSTSIVEFDLGNPWKYTTKKLRELADLVDRRQDIVQLFGKWDHIDWTDHNRQDHLCRLASMTKVYAFDENTIRSEGLAQIAGRDANIALGLQLIKRINDSLARNCALAKKELIYAHGDTLTGWPEKHTDLGARQDVTYLNLDASNMVVAEVLKQSPSVEAFKETMRAAAIAFHTTARPTENANITPVNEMPSNSTSPTTTAARSSPGARIEPADISDASDEIVDSSNSEDSDGEAKL